MIRILNVILIALSFFILCLLYSKEKNKPIDLPVFSYFKTDGTVFKSINFKSSKHQLIFYFPYECESCFEEAKKIVVILKKNKNTSALFVCSGSAVNEIINFQKN